ncbi:MAG: family 10 glycosylhydrolase [bacterium]
MRTISFQLFLAVLISIVVMSPLPCSGDSFLESFRSKTPILPKDELRAAWVVRYALTSREGIDRAVDYAVRARFHLLFVQVRGRADAYYRSNLESSARDLELPVDVFDPLDYFLKRAHEAGIAVHVWINVFYVWSDHENRPPDGHIVLDHPEWLATNRDGVRMDQLPVSVWTKRGLEGSFVSPGNPEARRHIVDVIADIAARYPIDGVHLDYVRYPGIQFDYGVGERTAFALRYGVDPLRFGTADSHEENPIAGEDVSSFGSDENTSGGGGDESFLGTGAAALIDSLFTEWRVAQVDSLVRSVRDVIGGLPLSAAVIPESETARIAKGQDWVGWIQRGLVDFVVPMAYTYTPAELVPLVRTIRRTIGADRFLVGLPVFDDRSRYLGYSVSLLRHEDVLGYALFSYNELEKESFSIEFLQRVFFPEGDAVPAAEDSTDSTSPPD